MTRGQFDSLRPGSVIRWKLRGGQSAYRTVMQVKNGSITLPIRKRSWTDRLYTVYCWNDVRVNAIATKLTTSNLMLHAEMMRLWELGFDLVAELDRELSERHGALHGSGPDVLVRIESAKQMFSEFTKAATAHGQPV